MENTKMKIALVIPWFAKDLKGGAEQHAWQLAARLQQKGIEIEVLSTCSKEFLSDWSINHYQPKEYIESGILIKRFLVKKRNTQLFDQVNCHLMNLSLDDLTVGISPLDSEQEHVFLEHCIYSPDLQRYIEQNESAYDFFLFIPFVPGIWTGAFVSLAVGLFLSRKAIKNHQNNSKFKI